MDTWRVSMAPLADATAGGLTMDAAATDRRPSLGAGTRTDMGLDLPVGTPVEVRNKFCSAWSRGFEVVANTGIGYTLRRQSDSYVLPAQFVPTEVRRQT